MKKILVTLTAALVCLGAFAQGRVNFNNDSLHLVYFTTDPTGLAPGDSALAGQGYYQGMQPSSGASLVADLFAGSSAGTLALVKTTTFTNSPSVGKWVGAATTLPNGLGAGVTAFFQVTIHDSRDADAGASQAAGHYFGSTPVFVQVPGSVSFVNLYNHVAGSTWPDGQFNMDTQAGLPGARGSIELRVIPEPTTFALAGLGAAALMIFRRRK